MDDSSPMPFGIYKGRALREVPAGYLLFLHEQGKRYWGLTNFIEHNLEKIKEQAEKNKKK